MHTILISTRSVPRTCPPRHAIIQLSGAPPTGHFGPGANPQERGAALITALMILLIMTLLGITAITTSSLEQKMAGNMRDQYMAQQAGDSIIRDAESWIFKLTTKPTPVCPPASTERVWDTTCLPDVTQQSDSWWSTNGYAANVSNSYVNQNPRYVDELLQRVQTSCLSCSPKVYRYYFRTSGWSVGFSSFAHGLFQTTFSRTSDEFQN
jgi:type IV pilus assembly protein PilX